MSHNYDNALGLLLQWIPLTFVNDPYCHHFNNVFDVGAESHASNVEIQLFSNELDVLNSEK